MMSGHVSASWGDPTLGKDVLQSYCKKQFYITYVVFRLLHRFWKPMAMVQQAPSQVQVIETVASVMDVLLVPKTPLVWSSSH